MVVYGGVVLFIEFIGGFVGDLIVWENVCLIVGLYGMSCVEIFCCFDDIIGFVEFEDFLDMLYKYFLSGMKVWFVFLVVF